MTRKTRKTETTEQKLSRWLAGAVRATEMTSSDREQVREEWEAGMSIYITVGDANYERYGLPEGGYVVIEWTDGGDISVC